MTWAEFRIRLNGWKRKEEMDLMKMRELAWITYIAPHQDPKKIKKTKDAFWPLNKHRNSKVTDAQKEALLEAQREYLMKKKEKENG